MLRLKVHVASVCFKCFRCFIVMLQLFHADVAKVDSICCNSCTCTLQAFIPNVSCVFSVRMLQLCLSGCCICFTHMLHVFYLDVVYGYNGFQVFHKHVSSVSTVFIRMLQPLYLDVSKVDQELHISSSHLLLHRLFRSRQGIHTNER
jgi:hypothetical protein